MGDKICLKDLQFLYGHLWQFDIVNESTNQQTRLFIEDTEFKELMRNAKESAKPAKEGHHAEGGRTG